MEDGSTKIQKAIQTFLNSQKHYIINNVISKYSNINKSEDNEDVSDTNQWILTALLLDYSNLPITKYDVTVALEEVYIQSGNEALKSLNKNDEFLIDQVKKQAVKDATKRVDEMFAEAGDMNIIIGTNSGLGDLIQKAMDEGWSNDTLATELENSFNFSPNRAEMIARTETNRASNDARLVSYKAVGIKKKKWWTAHDSKVSQLCRHNEREGSIDIDKEFSGGSYAPPGHPRCRCTLLAVLLDADGNELDNKEIEDY
jgi:SPP1 gp7 family putative phage head morphogenesis protein